MTDSRSSSSAAERGAQRVGWLELFYDLVFVATIVTFSEAVTEHPDVDVIATVVAAFAAVWWIWLVTTLLANRFRVDDGLQRALVLVQMMLLLLIALNVGDGFERHEGTLSILYAILCADVAIMHGRHAHVAGISGDVARARRNEYAVASLVFFVAGFFAGPARYALWAIGFMIILVPSFRYLRATTPKEEPLDEQHLSERLGLLTIIVCGEAFVKVSLLATVGTLDSLDVVVVSTLFVVVFAMWWSYFDDIPDAGVSQRPGPLQLWFVAHLAFQVSVVGIAVGFGELVQLGHVTTMDDDHILLTAGPLAIALVALAGLGVCTCRRPAKPLLAYRLGAAAMFVVVGVVIGLVELEVEPAAAILAALSLGAAGGAALLLRRTRVLPP